MERELPKPNAKFFLRVLVLFAFSAAAWFLLRRPYTQTLAFGGSRMLALFAPAMDPDRIVRSEGEKFLLDTGIRYKDGKSLIVELEGVWAIGWSSVFLLTLLGLTPWRRLRASWRYAVLAGVLLWLFQAAAFSVHTLAYVDSLYRREGLRGLSPSAGSALTHARDYLSLLNPFVPFVLYAPVFFRKRRIQPSPQPEGAGAISLSRNAPCPCGSGSKYKRCCGSGRM
jgi:hypothetical protein